ncbi:P47 [Aratus pisonii nudivirus]|nr:P47 [Aratus pisonii nudivirus]
MSLKGDVPNANIILSHLCSELDKFTKYKNTDNVCKIVNCLYDVDIKTIIKVLLQLKQLNEKKVEIDLKIKTYYLTNIYKLINSKNHLDDADTHPIGQDLSIFSCATKSQNVLNVKRLTKKIKSENVSEATDLVKHIYTLGFKNENIKPAVKDNSLYTNEISWFRLILNGDDTLSSFKELYNCNVIKDHMIDVYVVNEDYHIIELYYNKKAKKANLMKFFNNSDLVKEIVFCSDLVTVKKMKIDTCDIFSNMLKFYYCYKTNHFNFTLTSQKDIKIFHYVYLICSIFIQSSKSVNNKSFTTPAPLSGLSYCKPMTKIQPKSRLVEDISEYERNYLKENGDGSLCDTAATPETLEIGKRHVLYTVNQDRDKRVLHSYGNVGGVNHSELVIEPDEETKKFQIQMLRNLSVKRKN